MGNKQGQEKRKTSKDKGKRKASKDKGKKKDMESKSDALDEKKVDPDEYINRITIYVIQARNLPKYDVGPNAKSDPYVEVKFGDLEHADYRTLTVRRELNPVWNAQFREEGQGLFKEIDKIRLDVFDHDTISKDDFMGYCLIKTDQEPNAHYSTAVQWVDLLDNNGDNVIGPNKGKAAIQIRIKYTLNVDDTNIRYYTHVMEFTVKKGKNLRNKELIGKSDPYVKLEYGAQTYVTAHIKNNISNPEWNETAYLFVHSSFHDKYQLKLCVMDKDTHSADDHLGTGYISAQDIFKECASGNTFNVDVNLREIPVSLDRGLIDFIKNDQFKVWGDLEVSIKLKEKEIVDREFYSALVRAFDKNNDGVIDRDEVFEMFAELKIPQNADDFLSKFDSNNDMKLDENEVISMLTNSDFQGSELATQLMAIYLGGHFNGDYRQHLMSGFNHSHSSTSKVIKIKDRETGLLVQEFVPQYVWYALKLIYDTKVNRAIVQSSIAHKILAQMSKSKGDAMDNPESAQEIPSFIRQHNLDTRSLYKSVSDYVTFNDFFARGINVNEYRELSHPSDDSVILSPADCRMMVWDSILDSSKIWIKGAKFTTESLFTKKTKINIKKYSGGAFVIARLAPQDYHRWHYPLDGTIENIEYISGALYTVNPIAINKVVDVYTQNKRAIVEINNKKYGSYIMFVIAATMVGSYKLHKKDHENPQTNDPIPLQINDQIQRGSVAGEFRFGGSTILLLFQNNIKINFDDDLQRNVQAKFETLVNVRSRIARIIK